MYPIIFQYNGLVISSYGLMLMLAFLTCNILLKKYLVSISKDERIADDIIFYAAIGGILGSKLYYVIEESKYFDFLFTSLIPILRYRIALKSKLDNKIIETEIITKVRSENLF